MSLKNKNGLSLIEISIALAIGAIFMMVFYNAFRQTTSTVRDMNGVIENNTSLIIGYQQIEQDIAGMIVLPASKKDVPEKKPALKDGEKAAEVVPSSSNKEKEEPFFQFKQENNRLQSLKFLTLSARTGYQEQLARPVWVLYEIKEYDVIDDKKLYALVRAQEPYTSQQEKAEHKSRFYPILENILRMQITVFAQEKNEEAEKKSGIPEYKALENWDPKKYKEPIPAYFEFKGVRWDSERRREAPFEFVCATYCELCEAPTERSLVTSDSSAAKDASQKKTESNKALNMLTGKGSIAPRANVKTVSAGGSARA